MRRYMLLLGLLAPMLAMPGANGQTTSATPTQQAASAVDPASIQAIKDMGAYLQTLKRFRVSVDLTGERVLADGQKLQHTAMAPAHTNPSESALLLHQRFGGSWRRDRAFGIVDHVERRCT